MPKKLLITQSNYVPWKGYFDAIHHCDEFVLYDDMQYTKQDWRNRNKIKTPKGTEWISIPVEKRGRLQRRIRDTRIVDRGWAGAHWRKLREYYAEAPCLPELRDWVEGLYGRAAELGYLSEVNHLFLREICDFLGIGTPFRWSDEFELAEDRSQRLVDICLATGATEYWSGPAARAYLDESLFTAHGLAVHYFDHSGYAEYPQLHPPFEHGVSILDLLLNTGKQATQYMKSFGPGAGEGRAG